MNYVYIQSYQAIFLLLYLKKYHEKVAVITISKNVRKFMEFMQVECILIERKRISVKKVHTIIDFKKSVIELFSNIEFGSNLYFVYNAIDIYGFYLIRMWNKKVGVVYYKDLDVSRNRYHFKAKDFISKKKLKLILEFLIYRIFMGLNLTFYCSNRVILGINDDYLKSNDVRLLKTQEDFDIIKQGIFEENQIELDKTDIILATQGLTEEHAFININSVREVYMNLLNLGYKVKVKCHPSDRDSVIFKDLLQYPSYLPAELIINNATVVVSIYSTTLVHAAKMRKVKSISLIDMVEWYSPVFKENAKNYLLNSVSDAELLFPKDKNELSRILSKAIVPSGGKK